MARAGRHRVQPDPRRRNPGLEVPRPGDDRHDPRPAHRRAGPHRPLSPPAASPPARAMALGAPVAGDVHLRRRTTRLRDLTTQPQRRNQGPEVEDTDRPAAHPRPNQKRPTSDPIRPPPKADRWIEDEAGPTGFGLARHLNAAGVQTLVAAPSKLQRPVGDRVKTDAKDALHLARLLKLGEIVQVAVPSVGQEAARDLVRAREDARGDLMSARHRLSKLLLRQGIVYSGGKAWTMTHDQWLRRRNWSACRGV